MAFLYAHNYPEQYRLRTLNWQFVEKREKSTPKAAVSSFLMTHESRCLHDWLCPI